MIEEQAAQAAGPASAASVQLGDLVPRTQRSLKGPCEGGDADSKEPGSAAEQFLALLECTYLVAAADSVTAEELSGLCTMIEVVTGAELSPAALQAYFREFRVGLQEQGRAARVRAIANTLGDFVARQEALHLAVLFAVADGTLARKETRILIEIAEAFGHSIAELQVVLDEVGSLLREALAR